MDDTNRQVRLARRPDGRPSTDDFETVETNVPTPGDHEVLVRTRYLSVDPYMRGRMRATTTYHEPWAVGEVLEGGVVGDVVVSNHPEFDPGDVVTGRLDWADYGVADGDDLIPVDPDLAHALRFSFTTGPPASPWCAPAAGRPRPSRDPRPPQRPGRSPPRAGSRLPPR